MEPRNAVLWILLVVLAVLAMPAGIQAQELREVSASEILEKIQAGEDVHLENVRITGEFNLSKIKLETVPIARTGWEIYPMGLKEELKIVESEITIVYSIFENNVDFSNTQFKKPTRFDGDLFLGISDFTGAVFGGDAYFPGTTFNNSADFGGTNFSVYAEFGCARFGGYADFGCARFGGDAVFVGADFSRDADFGSARFGGYAEFLSARFGGYADFGSARFGGYAAFVAANFSRDVDFERVNFNSTVHFIGADFGGDANFEYVDFDGGAGFSRVNFSGDVDFEGANFGGGSFSDAKFSGGAIFNYVEFNKVVSFSNTKFTKVSLHETDLENMEVEWISLKDALVFDGLSYVKLIKKFREMEQFNDADDAYYQYRRLSQANKEWSSPKLEDIFMWISCGYGVRPWRAPVWGVIIIFIFGLIYMPGTLNFWPFTRFNWLRESGIRRLKESGEDYEQDKSCCEVLYSVVALLTMIGLILLFCNLGVKPYYTAILTVAMLLLYALIYRGNNIDKQDASFCDAFYFSVTTFTTLGYGDWYPKDRYRMFAMIEGLAGWIVLALFLVTLANVMIRP